MTVILTKNYTVTFIQDKQLQSAIDSGVSSLSQSGLTPEQAEEFILQKKTWREWDKEKIGDIKILDPDGFRDFPDDRLYDLQEFITTRMQSTVMFRAVK